MNWFAVIGLGSFGTSLAHVLARLGAQVLAVDKEMAKVEAIKDDVHTALRMDARDSDALEEMGVSAVECAVVCMGEDFEAAEICAVHLTELGCPEVLVRGTSRERAQILRALVPGVIEPSKQAARELAVKLLAPGVVAYGALTEGMDVVVVEVPETAVGATLGDLAFGEKPEVHLLALRRTTEADDHVMVGPSTVEELRKGDLLYLMGEERDLIRAARHTADARS